jgi:hypothetical protein
MSHPRRQNRTVITVRTSYFCKLFITVDFNQNKIYWQILVECPIIEFHENLSSSQVVTLETDKHGRAERCIFAHFCCKLAHSGKQIFMCHNPACQLSKGGAYTSVRSSKEASRVTICSLSRISQSSCQDQELWYADDLLLKGFYLILSYWYTCVGVFLNTWCVTSVYSYVKAWAVVCVCFCVSTTYSTSYGPFSLTLEFM